MAVQKPLVLINGRHQQLPDGDQITGVAVVLPFTLSNGNPANINLTTGGSLSFTLSDGTPTNIPLGSG